MPEEKTVTVIKPTRNLLRIDLLELWKSRYLISMLVKRDLTAVYKQSILGPTWHLIQPMFATLVLTLVFGKIVGIETEGVPHVVFYLCSIVFWTFFSNCFRSTSRFFLDNANVMSKVYFPRLAVPIATIISKGVTFLIQFLLFVVVFSYFAFMGSVEIPGLTALMLPVFILLAVILAFSMGLFFSALTVKYRDISYVLEFIINIWMYITPIIFPLTQVSPQWRPYVLLNPVAPLVEAYRGSLLGTSPISFDFLLISIGTTAFFLLVGIIAFNRSDRTFVDTI